ncbi:hypothetical protein BDR03DRAFT_563043 [Suillus americanus]|nr:hypothetical protein BDR03DRAFT_563043 [Suillus americanus]
MTNRPSIRVSCPSFPSLLPCRSVRPSTGQFHHIHLWHVYSLFLFPSSICVFSFTGTRQILDSFTLMSHVPLARILLLLFPPRPSTYFLLCWYETDHGTGFHYQLISVIYVSLSTICFPLCRYETGIGLFHLRHGLGILTHVSFSSLSSPHRSLRFIFSLTGMNGAH